jgi:hypothetical protein
VRQHLGNGVRLHERSAFEGGAGGAFGQDGGGRSGAVGGGDLLGSGAGWAPRWWRSATHRASACDQE